MCGVWVCLSVCLDKDRAPVVSIAKGSEQSRFSEIGAI